MATESDLNGLPIPLDIDMVADTAQRITDELHRVIVGKDELIETLFSCLLAEGHILVEGNPGLAKTTITKLFAHTLGCTFNRQQFTPDLLPGDITGSYVFDQKTSEFYVRKGGIFANIVMVDELNRATPRTQSALLEAMEERMVTIEGTTFPLEKPFMVLATQTTVNIEGTFPLPEVQLDRFYVKVTLDYPSTDEELQILNVKLREASAIAQVTDREAILRMIDIVRNVYVDEKVLEYIRDIVVSTRNHKDLVLPASPRASIALLGKSRARAAIRGRDYVIPDDVKAIAYEVLNHRLLISPESEIEGVTLEEVIAAILMEARPSR
ncbi:MAG: MoxR family ATPase [Halobacteriota archaeon]